VQVNETQSGYQYHSEKAHIHSASCDQIEQEEKGRGGCQKADEQEKTMRIEPVPVTPWTW
jgi:hypothetical protein